MKWELLAVTCAALWLWPHSTAAQFVEVQAEIEITSARYQEETGLSFKQQRSYSVRCVVGTNSWMMENDFSPYAKETHWFTEGKIIRQLTYAATDDDEPNEAPRDRSTPSTGGRTSRYGSRAGISTSNDGYPGGELHLNIPWFAFCSGPYLKSPGRQVPLPAPLKPNQAFGFDEETEVFSDKLGLPRKAMFRTGKREVKCDYQVQQTTNVAGWNFPAKFTIVQNQFTALNTPRPEITVAGRITSIRSTRKPELPEEIQERLIELEQSPSRRR